MARATFQVTYQGMKIDQPNLVAEVAPIIRRTHHQLTRRIKNLAQQNAPDDSGNLKRQIREDEAYFSGLLTMQGGVTSHADYSLFVHEGTKPHDIHAKPGGALSFPWHGGRAFFDEVHHPGTEGKPFLRDAAREALLTDPDIIT